MLKLVLRNKYTARFPSVFSVVRLLYCEYKRLKASSCSPHYFCATDWVKIIVGTVGTNSDISEGTSRCYFEPVDI